MKRNILYATAALMIAASCVRRTADTDDYGDGVAPFISVDNASYALAGNVTDTAVTVSSNVWWKVAVTNYSGGGPSGWVTGIDPSELNATRKINFKMTPNLYAFARKATVTVSPQVAGAVGNCTFTLEQAAIAPFTNVTSDDMDAAGVLNLAVVAGTFKIHVTANADWTIDNTNAPWLLFTPSSAVADPYNAVEVTCLYSDNSNAPANYRDGSFTIKYGGSSKVVNVHQDKEFPASVVTVDNGETLIANWTPVAGCTMYTLVVNDAASGANVANINVAPPVTTYDLGGYFSAHPYTTSVNVTVKAASANPAIYSMSNVVATSPLFGNGSGNGTPGNEYLIASVRHLKNINNSGELSKCYKQVIDIDFTGQSVTTYTPVGNQYTVPFTGIYSGAKGGGGVYKIMNASFTINDLAMAVWGIFGYVGANANVGYLEFTNCTLNMALSAPTVPTGTPSPGFAHAVGINMGGTIHDITMTGCVINLNMYSSAAAIGSVVGRKNSSTTGGVFPGTVSYCTTKGGSISYTASLNSEVSPAGGLYDIGGIAGAGETNSIVDNCANISTPVKSRARAAGIVGSNCSVTNSYNMAPVECSVNAGGGIVAIILSGGPFTISNCYNTGEVAYRKGTAADYVGGILGRGNTSSGVTVDRCFNSGNVLAVEVQRPSMFGGIVGDLNNVGTVTNCFNTGKVDFPCTHATTVSYAGGIVGNIANTASVVANCYNTGVVSGAATVATSKRTGVVGNVVGSSVTVKSCYYLAGTALNDVAVNGTLTNVTDCGPKSSDALSAPATFATWDFVTIWKFAAGYPYPQLSGLPYVPASAP